MTGDELLNSLSYASILTDFRLLIGSRNRLLVSRSIPLINSGNVSAPNPNRVAIAVGLDLSHVGDFVTAATVVFSLLDSGGNPVYVTTVFSKQADVAAVTPSPFVYAPVLLNVTQVGPIIQGQPKIAFGGGMQSTDVFAMEILMAYSDQGPRVPPSSSGYSRG